MASKLLILKAGNSEERISFNFVTFQSWNHAIIQVEKDLQDYLVQQSPCYQCHPKCHHDPKEDDVESHAITSPYTPVPSEELIAIHCST